LDSVFDGYEKDINENVRTKLLQLKMVVEPFLTSGNTLREMVKAQQYYNEDTARKSLTDVQSKLELIKSIRKLTPVEELVHGEIGAYIQTGKFDTLTTPQKDDGKDGPTSTLTIADLVEALKGTKELKESDLTLTDWQGTTNFKEKSAIKSLVEDYKPGATKAQAFQEHLKHDWKGKSGKDWSTDDYWEKFVKEKPKFIIGAIRHYEWENATGAFAGKAKKDPTIITEMGQANNWKSSDEKEVVGDDKWDTDNPSHIAEFLYKKAEGKSGKNLCRSTKTVGTNGDNEEENEKGVLAHLKANWHWYGLAILAIITLLVVIFWKNISEWWNGPVEEEGQGKDDDDEKKDEDE